MVRLLITLDLARFAYLLRRKYQITILSEGAEYGTSRAEDVFSVDAPDGRDHFDVVAAEAVHLY